MLMDISLTTHEGKSVLEVIYDPMRLSWGEAISAGLAAYGIQRHQAVTVIARPVAGDNAQGENG